MRFGVLGRTGLRVSRLGYGAMELRRPLAGEGPTCSEPQAEAILNAVLDAGINFIDTSPDYGRSEERIGRYVGSRRKEFFLATKCGCNPPDMRARPDEPHHIWTRAQLLRNIEESLHRLRTDYVDVLQLHNPYLQQQKMGRTDVAMDELIETLGEIRSQGLARFIGVSTTLPWMIEHVERDVFDAFQVPYSCLQPEHDEAIRRAAATGAGIVIRGGIARGGPDAQAAPAPNSDLWRRARLDDLLDGMKPSEFLLRFTLSHPHCDTTIVGTCDAEHLAENLAAVAAGPLPQDVCLNAIRRITDATAASRP
ncbi:aldo/keto reductase [Candidatus Sumerlaeota bacterium]|nr:aldo/keto reductase [Candidatus Sumerlaeota bacterium]